MKSASKSASIVKTVRVTQETNNWFIFLSKKYHITLTEALHRTAQMAQQYERERQLERELIAIAADQDGIRDDVKWAEQNLD